MNEIKKEEKYQHVKRATILSCLSAVAIFIFESFMVGAPMISMFVLIYVIILIPGTLLSIRNKPRLKYYGYRLIVYTVLVASSFGFHQFDLSIARSRAETVIAAVEKYREDKSAYPESLQGLVPGYITEIPKPRIAPSRFYYLGTPQDPHLMYMEFPPFGSVSWSFNNKEWITID